MRCNQNNYMMEGWDQKRHEGGIKSFIILLWLLGPGDILIFKFSITLSTSRVVMVEYRNSNWEEYRKGRCTLAKKAWTVLEVTRGREWSLRRFYRLEWYSAKALEIKQGSWFFVPASVAIWEILDFAWKCFILLTKNLPGRSPLQ